MKKIFFIFIFLINNITFSMETNKETDLNDELYWSIRSDNLQKFKTLVDLGININSNIIDTDWFNTKKPILIFASEHGSINIIKYLISQGINLNLKDRHGNTALIIAILNKRKDIARLLLESGANVNEKDDKGQTALIKLVERNEYYSEDLINLLLNYGADLNIKDNNGYSALNYAKDRAIKDFLKKRIEKSKIFKKAATLSSKKRVSQELFTAIANLDYEKALELVKELLNIKVSFIGIYDKNGNNFLHAAILVKDNNETQKLQEKLKIIGLLLSTSKGLITEKQNKVNGISAIELASQNPEILKKLLSFKEKSVIRFKKDSTDQDKIKIGYELLQAVENQNIQEVKRLIETGANLNYNENFKKQAPIYIAVQRKNMDIIKLLVDAGADLNVRNYEGWTPLIYAVSSNEDETSLKIINLLLEAGADVNLSDNTGQTPIMNVGYKPESILKLLLDYGADVNKKDKEGKTPLMHIADTLGTPQMQKLNYNLAKMLLEAGAKVGAIDAHGKTALDYAKNRNQNIYKLLKSEKIKPDLISAINTGDYDKVKDLIKQIIFDIQDKQDNNILHIAINASNNQNKIKIFELILNSISTSGILDRLINQKNKNEKTPIELAANNPDILNKLLTK